MASGFAEIWKKESDSAARVPEPAEYSCWMFGDVFRRASRPMHEEKAEGGVAQRHPLHTDGEPRRGRVFSSHRRRDETTDFHGSVVRLEWGQWLDSRAVPAEAGFQRRSRHGLKIARFPFGLNLEKQHANRGTGTESSGSSGANEPPRAPDRAALPGSGRTARKTPRCASRRSAMTAAGAK